MVNPNDIVDAVVTKIRAISAVVALVGGDANAIYAYEPSFPSAASLEQALNEMPSPSVLVCHRGFSTGAETVSRTHQVSIFIVPDGSPWDLLVAILDGIPSGDSEAFKDLEILSTLDPPQEYSALDPTQQDFAEVTFDLYSIQLSYREKRN